jgi:hypothetical protein
VRVKSRNARSGSKPGFGDRGPGQLLGPVMEAPVNALAVCIQTHDVKRRIDDAVTIHFREDGVLICNAGLQYLHVLSVGQIPAQPEVGEAAILTHGCALKVRYEVGEHVTARMVVELILPRESSEGEQPARTGRWVQTGAMLNVRILDR